MLLVAASGLAGPVVAASPAQAHTTFCNYSAFSPQLAGSSVVGLGSFECYNVDAGFIQEDVWDLWGYTCLDWYDEDSGQWLTWGCGPGTYEFGPDWEHDDDRVMTCWPSPGGGWRFQTWFEGSNINIDGYYQREEATSGHTWLNC
jgi:hypothetical protein